MQCAFNPPPAVRVIETVNKSVMTSLETSFNPPPAVRVIETPHLSNSYPDYFPEAILASLLKSLFSITNK